MIVAIISIALVIYIALLATEVELDEQDFKVSLAAPEVSSRAVDDHNLTDITVGITKIVPRDGKLLWSEIGLTITSSNGTMIIDEAKLRSDDPSSYSTGTHQGVEVWYIDSPSGTHRMEPGDSIKITGITLGLEGGRVDLLIYGKQSGSFVIPIS